VSIQDCTVDGTSRSGVGGARSDFGHRCDTLAGSSGAPVIDLATGTVLGLHHWGYLESDPEPVNQAVHSRLILEDLETNYPAVHRQVTERAEPPPP
jgi:hypothetical protein